MTLYDRLVLPKLIHFAMTRNEATRLRAAHVPAARGVVLEVGIGSGLNLPFYTSAVTHLYGVDRSAELLAMAKERATTAPFPVELFDCSADRIPLPDASVDTVVVTWSLCSIAGVVEALHDMRRVLKPDGTLIFVEHGLSSDAGVRKWQNRLTPFWRVFTGGCHLNRKMDDLVRNAGFTIADLRTEYVPGPRALTFMYEGVAGRRDHAEHSNGNH
ncbi:MAG: class I SAM-dependent methyltransferase [Vicinamibacterales bacterium]